MVGEGASGGVGDVAEEVVPFILSRRAPAASRRRRVKQKGTKEIQGGLRLRERGSRSSRALVNQQLS